MGAQSCIRIRQPLKHPVPVTLVIIMMVVAVGDLFFGKTMGSEFPERECCDNVAIAVPPHGGPPPHGSHFQGMNVPEHSVQSHSTPSTVTTDPPGVQTKTASAIMNCIQARDSCMNNTACHPILEVVPRVCGAEKVACSTVTITKCQAALRTLQAFPYFYPTCLCREPMSDPACNTFRDYLFDHPCSLLKVKGKYANGTFHDYSLPNSSKASPPPTFLRTPMQPTFFLMTPHQIQRVRNAWHPQADHPTRCKPERDPYPVDALPTCDYAIDVCKKEHKCISLLRDFRQHCKAEDHQCKMEDGEQCHDAWTKLRLSPIFGCICPNSHPKCERIFREVNYNPCVAIDPSLELNGSTSALFSLDQHRLASLSPHMSFSPASLFPPRPGPHLYNHYQAKYRHFQHHRIYSNAIGAPHETPEGRPPLKGPPKAAASPPHSSVRQVETIPAALTESQLIVDESFSTPISSYAGIPSASSGPISTSHSGSITVQVISSSHAPELDSQLETPLLGPPSGGRGISRSPPFVPATPHRAPKEGPQTPPSDIQPPPRGSIATISSIKAHVNPSEKSSVRFPLQTTCLTALQNCRRHAGCIGLLEPVLHFCDPTRCRQETCMNGLQKFYREVEPKWALDVAFCMCGRTENRHDQCRLAQEQLHPVCAQRGDLGVNPPSCHSLAESCRAQADCRHRLEEYEQMCAVDSVTKKCAGPTEGCRSAMLRILGTKLRTSCACNGTDFTQLYDCLGWQRILWVNPCVVESQRDYHRTRATQAPIPQRSTTTLSQSPTQTEPIISFETVMPGTDVLSTTMGILVHTNSVKNTQHVEKTPSTSTTTHSSRSALSTTRTKTRHSHKTHKPEIKPSDETEHLDPEVATGHYDTTTERQQSRTELAVTEEVTTMSTTTGRTEPTTTTQPPRYCPLRQPKPPDQKIREGQAKRLYRDDVPTCSELCVCEFGRLEVATCTVLECLETTHCYVKTEDQYAHLQPTYIAHRGNCKCYAGRFICEKPPPDTYTLSNGVFLFIGYSSRDEQVLKQHTGLGVGDVVNSLRQLIMPQTHHYFFDKTDPNDTVGLQDLLDLNATECRLDLFKVEGENIIINAIIWGEDYTDTRQPDFTKEKSQCLPVLHVLKDLINSQHTVIHSHRLLSILKLAAVEDNIPKMNAAMSTQSPVSPSSFNPYVLSVLVLTIHGTLAQVLLILVATFQASGPPASRRQSESISTYNRSKLAFPSLSSLPHRLKSSFITSTTSKSLESAMTSTPHHLQEGRSTPNAL